MHSAVQSHHPLQGAFGRYNSALRQRRSAISAFNLLQAYLVRRKIKDCTGPIFVVASPRSGTTALCKALNEHSHILMAWGGAPMLQSIGTIAYTYEFGTTTYHYKVYTGLLPEALHARLRTLAFDCVWANPFRLLTSSRKGKFETPSSVRRYLRVWGCKVSPDEIAANGLQWLFPDLRLIYVVRNGIDVVYSMSQFISFRDRPFDQLCRDWSDRVWRYDYLLKNTHSLCIRFEDFVSEPARTIARIFAHLTLPLQTQVAEFCTINLIHPLGGTTIKANPRSILMNRPAPHTMWSKSQKAVFRETCEKAMNYLNYPIPF